MRKVREMRGGFCASLPSVRQTSNADDRGRHRGEAESSHDISRDGGGDVSCPSKEGLIGETRPRRTTHCPPLGHPMTLDGPLLYFLMTLILFYALPCRNNEFSALVSTVTSVSPSSAQGCQVGDFIAKFSKTAKRLNLFLIRKCVWLNLNPSLPVVASTFWRFLTLFRPNLAKFWP